MARHAKNTSSIFSAAPASARGRRTLSGMAAMPYVAAVDRLVNYDRFPDDVDSKIGQPGYVGVTARAASGFQPLVSIDDARQRWLFRMVHSQRPLQEKMTLFWHNHFATAYSKINGSLGYGGSDRG